MSTATAHRPRPTDVPIPDDDGGWALVSIIARFLGISPKKVGQLADAGLIGVRELPGLKRRYSVADARRLARMSTTPAHVAGPGRAG